MKMQSNHLALLLGKRSQQFLNESLLLAKIGGLQLLGLQLLDGVEIDEVLSLGSPQLLGAGVG